MDVPMIGPMLQSIIRSTPRSTICRALALCALLAAIAALPACFSPRQPSCAFSCARAGACPEGYACGGDGYCHRAGAENATCALTPADGGPDAGADAPDSAP